MTAPLALAAIRERHWCLSFEPGWCAADGQGWPCDAAQLAASPAPLIDRERLARAVRSVTAAKRLDIIENDDDDMAGVVFPAEFADMVADAYERAKP